MIEKKTSELFTAVMFSSQLIKNIEPLFAKLLKEKKKIIVKFIAKTQQDLDFYNKNYKDCFDTVISHIKDNELVEPSLSNKDIENAALKFEKKYNITIYKLFFTDRIIGRGFFASGGVRHPRNRLHYEGNHHDMLRLALAEIRFWEKIFRDKSVQLALNLPNHAHIIAKKNGITSLRIQEGRVENTFNWTSNLYLHPAETKSIYDKVRKKDFKIVNISQPYKNYFAARNRDLDGFKLINCIKVSLEKILRLLYGKIKGYKKSSNTYILDEFFLIWRRRTSYFEYKRYVNTNLKKLNKENFIYFPLLTEPEIALHGIAQDFFFQLSAINLIARDLPANYRLVVKEHLLAIGRRPKNFYQQIADLKNVLIAECTESGIQYIDRAKATACLTGTAGWETAIKGKPVISFSKNNVYNFLNHVFEVKDLSNLNSIISLIIKNNYPSIKSREDGSRLYYAYKKTLIDIKDYKGFYEWQKDDFNRRDILLPYAKILYDDLIKKIKFI